MGVEKLQSNENSNEEGEVIEEGPNSDRKFRGKKGDYFLKEKKDLGQLVEKERIELEDKKAKSKKFASKGPKNSYVSKAVRSYYPALKNAKSTDDAFLKARYVAIRSHKKFLANGFPEKPAKNRCRAPGGGRKAQAPEVREALFDRYVDIRGALKCRLPRPILRAWAKELYGEWLEQQNPPIPEEKQLKFTDPWIQGWLEEFCISLQNIALI